MLRSFRFSIAGIMGAVLVVAIGVAALRNGSETSAGAVFLFTWAVLGLGAVGLICRGRNHRAWWAGFNLFGWGYMLLAFWTLSSRQVTLPTESLLRVLAQFAGHPADLLRFNMPGSGSSVWTHSFLHIGHCLWALLAAILGGIVSRALFGGAVALSEITDAGPRPVAPANRVAWLKPAIIGLSWSAVIVMTMLAGSRLDASLHSGLIFVLTLGLICLASLGAILCRGRHREIWLGAALFGGGFMIATFDWSREQEARPNYPTVRLLNAIEPWLSPLVRIAPAGSFNVEVENARIRKTLEQPVTMKITGERLDDVVKYVQRVTQTNEGKTIQIYVDPRAPGAAEGVFAPTMWIEMQGIPLKTSLRLCLKQLDLDYDVRDGMVFIASQKSIQPSPPDHSYLTIGHCLLALIAAAVGGVLGPFVSELRREPER